MSLPETKEVEFMPADFFTAGLQDADPAIYRSIRDELARQQDQIELIASENIVSRAVLEAQGSVLTNKYAEGLPGRRYYGGCEFVDGAETLAIERAKKLFGCDFANVQPHSGAQANGAVYCRMRILQYTARSAMSLPANRIKSSLSLRRTSSRARCSKRKARC